MLLSLLVQLQPELTSWFICSWYSASGAGSVCQAVQILCGRALWCAPAFLQCLTLPAAPVLAVPGCVPGLLGHSVLW